MTNDDRFHHSFMMINCACGKKYQILLGFNSGTLPTFSQRRVLKRLAKKDGRCFCQTNDHEFRCLCGQTHDLTTADAHYETKDEGPYIRVG